LREKSIRNGPSISGFLATSTSTSTSTFSHQPFPTLQARLSCSGWQMPARSSGVWQGEQPRPSAPHFSQDPKAHPGVVELALDRSERMLDLAHVWASAALPVAFAASIFL